MKPTKAEKHVSRARVISRRILVVDDNADNADTLAMLLRLAGHEVHVAQSGPAALEAARNFMPDIALLDIGLPGMDGFEVARRLRSDLGLTETLLVAVTGHGYDEDRRRSQDAGFNAHLVKPVNLAALNKIVASLHAAPDQPD
jgi:CheY-like chemotaxis protein